MRARVIRSGSAVVAVRTNGRSGNNGARPPIYRDVFEARRAAETTAAYLSGPVSLRRHAAVDNDLRSGNVAGIVAG